MKLDQPKKREIVIGIDDYCDAPFEAVDRAYLDNKLSHMLSIYDIEIKSVEIRDKLEEWHCNTKLEQITLYGNKEAIRFLDKLITELDRKENEIRST